MTDQYDRIYGYGSDIAAALREDDAASKAYAALPTVTKAIEPPPEERAVTEQQQTFSAKWNAWFADSFKHHMEPQIKAINKAFDAVEANIVDIAKALGAETKIDADGRKVHTLPSLDRIIAERVDKILKEFMAKHVETNFGADGGSKKVKDKANASSSS